MNRESEPAVVIENCLLRHGDLRLPLISGELQYWRLIREYWEPVVLRAKELGLRVISTYVPWVYHERAEGEYDFQGATSPQRDLVGFADLLRRNELYLIVRPGPYIYADMRNGGVPDRAAKLDRLAPDFLAMARHYIQAFAKAVRDRQLTRGGNIILCQADNEPYPPIENFGTEMGCFERDGLFKDWLRRKYGHDIARLNARWNTRLADFAEACVYFHEAYVDVEQPMAGRLLRDPATFPRYADTHEFVGWYAAKIVAETVGWLREGGLDIPVFANGWSPLYQDFHQFCAVADLTGIDVYPSSMFGKAGSPVKDNWFYNLDILKLQEADVAGGNVWSAEYQGGAYPPEIGPLPPQHFRFANRIFLAHGLKGWNWYILNTRGNWTGNPLLEFGEKNDSFDAVAAQNRLADRLEPWNCTPVNDASLFCYKPHRVSDPGDFEACFQLLQEADVSFDYYNPQARQQPTTNVLLYAGGDWIDDETEARLVAFVVGGGTLIAFNRYPKWRLDMATRTGLGLVDPDGSRPVTLPVDIRFGDVERTLRGAGHMGRKINLFFYHRVPGRPIMARYGMAATEVIGGLVQSAAEAHAFPIGYVLDCGRGRIVHFGTNPSRQLLEAALEAVGIRSAVRVDRERLLSHVHRHVSGRLVLYVANRAEMAQRCQVTLDGGRLGLAPSGRYRLEDPDGDDAVECSGAELARIALDVQAQDVAIRIVEPVND